MTSRTGGATGEGLDVGFVVAGGAILGTSARRAFVDGLEKYAAHVLEDASAFEDASRADAKDEVEITATHIRDALRAQRTRTDRRSRARKVALIVARLLLFGLAAVVGVAGNNFPDVGAVAWFTGSLTAGLFILGITEVLEWSR